MEVKAYYQADEPTDLNPGTQWFRDDGKAYIRKPDLTWNETGRWTEKNMGHVDIQGDTMLGSLEGDHGLAPLDSPPFTGIVTVNGEEVATKAWTTEQLQALQESLQNFIGGQYSGSEGTITIGNNLAIGFGGPIEHGAAIPLPLYGDGSRAHNSEVWGVIPSLHAIQVHDGGEANNTYWDISVDANLVVTCHVTSRWPEYFGSVNYLIICKR